MTMENTNTNPLDWHTQSGPLRYHPCNDYLFRAMMQEHTDILKMLLTSLLKQDTEPMEVDIMNPIALGKFLTEKDFILDTKVQLNHEVTVNVELQMWHQSFWKERALSYLCRIYDSLKSGENYSFAKKAIHIGIIDFPLEEMIPELYAEHYFMNPRTRQIFSDKLQLNVLCLPYQKLATEEDRAHGILMWARYFKAQTWEELHMLVKEYPEMEKPISTAFKLTQEQILQEQLMLYEETLRVRRSEEAEREIENQKRQKMKEEMTRLEEALSEINEKMNEVEQQLTETEQQRFSAEKELAEMYEKYAKAEKELELYRNGKK